MNAILKVCKWLYINPLTLALIAVCWITRQLELLFVTYGIMLIHELAHLAASYFIGLKPSYIALHPFGVNLRLKNKIIGSLSDEIILYSAGPCVNIIFALVSLIALRSVSSVYLYDFYIKNLFLFIINMLPIVPLDGGVILKKLLMYKYGYKRAQNVMLCISVIFTTITAVFGIYLIYINHMSFSVILLTVFMIGNIFTQREKYNVDFVREIIFYKDKKRGSVKIYVAGHNEELKRISMDFDMQNFCIVFFIDDKGSIENIMTETEILNIITSADSSDRVHPHIDKFR